MRVFKDEHRRAIMHPELLPGDDLFDSVRFDVGSDAVFLELLWRYLYRREPVADPGTPAATQRKRLPRNASNPFSTACAPTQTGRWDKCCVAR